MKRRNTERDRTVGEEARASRYGMLPKPVRTFSYWFFGAVVLIGVCGWMFSGNP
ncbi:hypothetical protein [Paenibacillus flagellatus]|uniref:hypothetical protein n=1 Tax=Paenibacillus flagellatus TaxID=2211139 RepID=UPI0013052E2B|nr:hypothetical protein [Paenibacillus flagellatus]